MLYVLCLKRFVVLAPMVVALVLISGCSDSGPPMSKVTGNVTFPDGTVPQGAQSVITFSPVDIKETEIKKGATADIEPDGSYTLYTKRPGDGVYYGTYNVIVVILNPEQVGGTGVALEFSSETTTPIEDKTVDSPEHSWDFVVEKLK